MFAYILYHFGNNVKYLEYELYFLSNLRALTKYDIIYGYTEDTPESFINKIVQLELSIKFYKIYDEKVTTNIDFKFNSVYKHFNTLRTCNFMYSYLLTDYKKICVVESDMYLLKSIDDIFNLDVPSVHYSVYNRRTFVKDHDYTSNDMRSIEPKVVLNGCTKGSPINGGIMLLQPSVKMFNQHMKSLHKIIKNNCSFPNEALFLINNPKYYSLPVKYNFCHAFLESGYDKIKDIRNIHYEGSIYKLLDTIRDNYFKKKYNRKNNNIIIEKYRTDIYLVYNQKIAKIMIDL